MASGGDGDESFSREEREDSWVAGLYQSDDEEELQQGTVREIVCLCYKFFMHHKLL